MTIEPFEFRDASPSEYQALHVFSNILRAERLPDDPPVPLSELTANLQNIPAFVTAFAWAAWNDDHSAILGSAHVGFTQTDENKHLVQFEIEVLPEQRRLGIGRRLMGFVVEVPQREGRRLMLTSTSDRVPAGEAFLTNLGAEKAMAGHTNQLVLAELDRVLLTEWLSPVRSEGFTLEFWKGPYPEKDLSALADLSSMLINTMPRDGIDMEDMKITPEQIRQMETSLQASGTERWTLAARETTTGEFAGYTEVFWNPNRPQIVNQGATGVCPEYRNRGLGRRLKAAMLDKVIRDRPEVQYVRTGNADSNGPMLRINHALGFKPYLSTTEWQVPTEKVLAYLSGTVDAE